MARDPDAILLKRETRGRRSKSLKIRDWEARAKGFAATSEGLPDLIDTIAGASFLTFFAWHLRPHVRLLVYGNNYWSYRGRAFDELEIHPGDRDALLGLHKLVLTLMMIGGDLAGIGTAIGALVASDALLTGLFPDVLLRKTAQEIAVDLSGGVTPGEPVQFPATLNARRDITLLVWTQYLPKFWLRAIAYAGMLWFLLRTRYGAPRTA